MCIRDRFSCVECGTVDGLENCTGCGSLLCSWCLRDHRGDGPRAFAQGRPLCPGNEVVDDDGFSKDRWGGRETLPPGGGPSRGATGVLSLRLGQHVVLQV